MKIFLLPNLFLHVNSTFRFDICCPQALAPVKSCWRFTALHIPGLERLLLETGAKQWYFCAMMLVGSDGWGAERGRSHPPFTSGLRISLTCASCSLAFEVFTILCLFEFIFFFSIILNYWNDQVRLVLRGEFGCVVGCVSAPLLQNPCWLLDWGPRDCDPALLGWQGTGAKKVTNSVLRAGAGAHNQPGGCGCCSAKLDNYSLLLLCLLKLKQLLLSHIILHDLHFYLKASS